MSFPLGNLTELLAGIGGLLVLLFGVWTAGRRKGAQRTREAFQKRDKAAAGKAKERVDAALDDDRDIPATERLRRQGRLRD